MLITKKTVADKMPRTSTMRPLDQFVGCAENGIMEDEFNEREMDVLRTVIARLGVADVRMFGMTWEDCEQALWQLGYSARVDMVTF